jgi:excisionase family DNA binding protein
MESRKRASHTKDNIKKENRRAPEREKVIAELKQNALYDTKEACELLGISTQSLRRAIAAGKVKTVRLGRFLRIPATEIDRLAKGETALLSAQEAAELLNVSIHMIRTLIKAEKIDAFRLAKSGPFKIPKSEIDRISREGIPQ